MCKPCWRVNKAVKPWWFVGANDKMMLELRRSNRRIDIAGKASIVVGTPDKRVATLSTEKTAVLAGELNLVMKGATAGRKRGRKAGRKTVPASAPTTTTSDRSARFESEPEAGDDTDSLLFEMTRLCSGPDPGRVL